jgi:hypothetical protein
VDELFELELLGGTFERRYRRMRPEVAAMPWGTIDASSYPEEVLLAARRAWTGAAFQEHRTAVACALMLRSLLEVRAPLDLVAMGSRFPLDEIVHVELCARLAMELGGGTELRHDPDRLVRDVDARHPPLLRAAELATRFFCVGEAVSIPLLRALWKTAKHPLPRAVLGRIVKDEAAHGAFGFAVLDWVLQHLDDEGRSHLGSQADIVIRALRRQWHMQQSLAPLGEPDPFALTWMRTPAYLELANRSMRSNVIEPLELRGIPISAQSPDDIGEPPV